MRSSRRRSVWALFGAWIVYWLILAGVKLGPAALAIWRATRGSPGSNDSSVNLSVGDWVLKLVVTQQGT